MVINFIANVQNICNLIGEEEYNIGHNTLGLHVVLFNKIHRNFRGREIETEIY